MSAVPVTAGTLHPFQADGLRNVLAALETQRTALVVWPTGCGKTVLMAHLAEVFARERRQRVLLLAHREELLAQAKDKIKRWTSLAIGLERAQSRAIRTGGMVTREWSFGTEPVVVASVQTISNVNRLSTWAPDEFGLVMVDEAHHSLADTYHRVIEHFTGAKVVGVTATPDRGDELALGQVYESVAHSYGIREAIDDGYLVPIRQHAVYVEGLDFSKVRKTAGDLNAGDLDKIMQEEEHLHAVANPIFELSEDRPTLTFATSVEHARLLAEQINRRAGENRKKRAEWLSGETDPIRRATTLMKFAQGEFQHLVGCALFLEGFDEPSISCVAMARPTGSRALYAQAIGRGTRLSPQTGKADLLVLDFVGNAGKHTLISPVDIFAGDMTAPIRAEVDKLRKENPGMAVRDLLTLAEQRAAEEAVFQARMRERKNIIAGTVHRTQQINPFGVLNVEPKRGRPGTPPASDRQIAALEKWGFPVPKDGLDRAQAGRVMDALVKRREAGLCSYKQAALLTKHGIDATRVSFEEASRMIDRIAKNGWRAPADLVREPGEN